MAANLGCFGWATSPIGSGSANSRLIEMCTHAHHHVYCTCELD